MNTIEEIQDGFLRLSEREQRVLQEWLEPLIHSVPQRVAEAVPLYGSAEMHAVQAAVLRLNEQERCHLRDWLNGIGEEETPEMLAAIDAGQRSLDTEPTFAIEDVRREIASWITR